MNAGPFTGALIGKRGGGEVVNIYLWLHGEFSLKSVLFGLISKEVSRAGHEYINI